MSLNAYHDVTAICQSIWKSHLHEGLKDDGNPWDWTTLGTLGKKMDRIVHAKVVVKAPGIWAATSLVQAVPSLAQDIAPGVFKVTSKLRDGDSVSSGQIACEWRGPARAVLALERPFLNLASYVSGIATRTNRLVSAIPKMAHPPRVTPTRKTLPGYRDVAIHGVIAGGGHPHRVTLSGGVLIKENHIAASGGIAQSVRGAREIAPHGLKIEIEVRNLAELKQALQAKADAVLLDNFTPAQVKEALALLSKTIPKPVVEVSGGINEKNIASYASTGVDVISSGSITLSVEALDLSLLID